MLQKTLKGIIKNGQPALTVYGDHSAHVHPTVRKVQRRRRVHRKLHQHHRCGIQDPHVGASGPNHQAASLGVLLVRSDSRRSPAVSAGCSGHHHCLRRDGQGIVQQCQEPSGQDDDHSADRVNNLLVGNKCDLRSKTVVSTDKPKELSDSQHKASTNDGREDA